MNKHKLTTLTIIILLLTPHFTITALAQASSPPGTPTEPSGSTATSATQPSTPKFLVVFGQGATAEAPSTYAKKPEEPKYYFYSAGSTQGIISEEQYKKLNDEQKGNTLQIPEHVYNKIQEKIKEKQVITATQTTPLQDITLPERIKYDSTNNKYTIVNEDYSYHSQSGLYAFIDTKSKTSYLLDPATRIVLGERYYEQKSIPTSILTPQWRTLTPGTDYQNYQKHFQNFQLSLYAQQRDYKPIGTYTHQNQEVIVYQKGQEKMYLFLDKNKLVQMDDKGNIKKAYSLQEKQQASNVKEVSEISNYDKEQDQAFIDTIPRSLLVLTYKKQEQYDEGVWEHYLTETEEQYQLQHDKKGDLQKTSRTITQTNKICGKGTEKCKDEKKPGEYKNIEKKQTTIITDAQDKLIGTQEIHYYLDNNNNNFVPYTLTRTSYGPNTKNPNIRELQKVEIYTISGDDNGNPVYQTDTNGGILEEGKTTFWFSFDATTGQVIDDTDTQLIDSPTLSDAQRKLIRQQKDVAAAKIIDSGAENADATTLLDIWQFTGRLMRGYQEMKGLLTLTTLVSPEYGEYFANVKRKLVQEFCLFAGIQYCVTQGICSQKKIANFQQTETGTTISTTRGPDGQPYQNAYITATKGQPIHLKGLPRERLIELFGNTTTIAGTKYDFTKPTFNPNTLPPLTITLYTFEYAITNNEPIIGWSQRERTLKYNIKFKGERTTNWYQKPQEVPYKETRKEQKIKYSATNYDHICLTFDPPITTQLNIVHQKELSELCTAFATPPQQPTYYEQEKTPTLTTPTIHTEGDI